MIRASILALTFGLLAAPLAAQTQHPPRKTVADLGTCSASGIGGPRFVIVTDGASATDCTVGNGDPAFVVPCWCDGTSWTVLGGGGGASALDDLTDVTTAGSETGEALIFGGVTWGASVAPAMLAGDAPTAHGASHEDGGTDELDLTGLSGLTATPQTPAVHVHAAGDLTSGTLAHERGGLEADVSLFGGLVRIAAGSTSAVTDLAGLNTALGSSVADGAHTVDTDNQTAPDVPYTPTTPTDWTDPDPADAGDALDDLAGRVTADEGALSTHEGNADAHHAEDHATRHSLAGADPVTVTNLASGCTDAQVLGGTAAGTGVECQVDATGTDDQLASEVPFTPAGGVAATNVQAAIEEVDAEHTVDTDTTCLDAGVACLFAASTTEGGAASSVAVDAIGLDQLAACAGPDEIVEYGASGVPSCIPTPSGGGGGAIAEGRAVGGGTTYWSIPGVPCSGTSTISFGTSRIVYEPIVVATEITLDRMGLAVTSGAAGEQARLGIYNADTSWQPTSLVLDAGLVDVSSTGAQSVTISQTLPAGRYLLALAVESGNPIFRAMIDCGGPVFYDPDMTNIVRYIAVNAAFGALASTGLQWNVVSTFTLGHYHVVRVRVSSP